MSGDDRLKAARQHVRDVILSGDMYELIFHRHRGSRKKMTQEEILHDRHLLTRRDKALRERVDPQPPRRRMSEAELEEAYSAAMHKNDPAAHSDLVDEAIACLSDERVKSYLVEILERHMRRISKARGRKGETNFIRNEMIVSVIENLQHDFGFNPTRGEGSKTRASGCSVVAGVLREGGLNRTERAVETIWRRRTLWP